MTGKDVQAIRKFNRFYTSVIGVLDRHVLDSRFSLPEARVLYELYHHQPCSATDLMGLMEIDKGYLSRILKSFEKRNILERKRDKLDGRASVLILTARGESEFAHINQASIKQLKDLLSEFKPAELKQLTRHMKAIELLLTKKDRRHE